jgi:hypothetical protein
VDFPVPAALFVLGLVISHWSLVTCEQNTNDK